MTDSISVLVPGWRATDSNDEPISGAKLEFYDAGTSTPKTVYSDHGLTVSLGSTVTCDSAGYPTSDGSTRVIIYTGTDAYKIVCTTSADATVWSHDNVRGASVTPATSTSALPTTPIVSKTAAYSVVVGDRGKLINANCTGGAFTITLPSAVTVGDNFRVGVRHAGTAGTVTIATVSSQTIGYSGQTSTSKSLASYGETMWLASDGANWSVDGYVPSRLTNTPGIILVTDRLTAPPSSPTAGARYIINGSPTGAWLTSSFSQHDIAEADGSGSWIKITPTEGLLAYVIDENLYTGFIGTAWTDLENAIAPTETENTRLIAAHTSSDGTGGGAATTGAWTALPYNSSVAASTGLSINTSTYTVTLPAGSWRVRLSHSFYGTNVSQIRFRSTVTGTVFYSDTRTFSSNTSVEAETVLGSGQLSIEREFTSVADETFIAEYYVATNGGSSQSLGYISPNSVGTEYHGWMIIENRLIVQGPRGEQGVQGEGGLDAAYSYKWSTATSGDPGSGKIRGNHATIASITEIAVSETASDSASLAAVLATWDDGTSSVKGTLKWSKEGATNNFAVFKISGAGTDQGSYWTFPVTYVATGGTLANNDDGALIVIEKGDIGDPGTTVPDISGLTLLASGVDETNDRLIIRDTSASSDKQVAPLTVVQETIEGDYVLRSRYASAQLAANAAAGKALTLASGDSVTLAVPGTFATLQSAVDACARWFIPATATVTIQVTGHVSTTGTIATINHPCADRIKIRGTTATSTTITQINSVSGSAGAYSVTATVADASGIAIGDVVMIRNVLPGVKPPGEYSGYPTRGELRLAFFALSSSSRAYIKTVGTTATVWTDAACTTTPADLVDDYIASGDIVIIAGQVRRATSPTAAGFTLSSALQTDVSGLQYWYHAARSAQGTITISGGTVTGNTTVFTTQYNVGDYIIIADTGVAKITDISADSGSGCITLDRTLPDCTTKSYSCLVLGELHEGAWLVTGKSGSQITWTNTARQSAAKPPVLAGVATQITGDVYVLTSSVRTTSTSKGIIVQGGATVDIDHLAVVGGAVVSSSSVGIDLRGSDQSNPSHPAALAFLPGHAKLGTRSAVINYGYGVWLQSNSFAGLDYAMICGNTVRGVNANFGGRISFKGTVISGNTGLGILVGPGAFGEWSDARIHGNSDDGVRGIGGGSAWYAEFPNLTCNGSDAIAVDDAVSLHNNGCRMIGHSSGDGIGSDNGGYGRMTGCLIIGSSVGVSWTSAQVEMSQNTILACGTGVIANNSRIDIDDLGIANCSSHAVRALGGAKILGRTSQITDCYSAIQCEEQSEIVMPGVALGGLSVTATGGNSRVWIQGYTSGGSFSPATLNRYDTDWNLIAAGSDVSSVPLFPTVELGATDTTLSRSAAGVMAVEGKDVMMKGGASTWYVQAHSAAAIAHTGTTSKTTLATIVIPANAMGPNGSVRVTTMWSYTNSANTKTLWVDFGTNAFSQVSATTSAAIQLEHTVSNRNSASAQVGFVRTATAPFSTSTGAPQTASVDTTANVNLDIAATLANSGETITLERYFVEILYGA